MLKYIGTIHQEEAESQTGVLQLPLLMQKVAREERKGAGIS